MGQKFTAIDTAHEAFIREQKLYFVATAAPEGRVNVSPKGMNSFRILGPNDVAYLDMTGSGAETAAHLRASPDGRLTIMFCAFEGAPRILRLYGRGRSLPKGTAGFEAMIGHFEPLSGTRQIIHLAVDLVQTSCGLGVPLFDYRRDRDGLVRWAEQQGSIGLEAYQRKKNMRSIDGLPTGFDPAAMNTSEDDPGK
jgi:hypothetical protein